MKINDIYYQNLMKNILYDLNIPNVNDVGKYLGTWNNCPCFEYKEEVLILFTIFPMFGGWMIQPKNNFLDIKDDIPLKFSSKQITMC